MTLLAVRDQLLKESGRYDLGTLSSEAHDGVDNGADWYINAGQRLLDRLISGDDLIARKAYTLAAGEYIINFKRPKTIEGVWLINSDGSTAPLTRKKFSTVRDYYNETISTMDTGTPLYWSPVALNLAADMLINDVEILINDMDDYFFDAAGNVYSIIITPPTDTALKVDILGRFFTPALVRNDDVTVWTEQGPQTLVMAAQYYLEVAHRNTEGAKDWLSAINLDIVEVDMADVALETEGINQMKG